MKSYDWTTSATAKSLRFSLQPTFLFPSSSFSSNIGNVPHVTTFGSEKHFGLVDIGYMELVDDTATGRKEETSSTESLP
jgi:hypothetical protein